MNGVHDMGGLQGFGPIEIETDEPPFHADWERRAFAITLAMGATESWNLDMSRSARESLPSARYLGSTYYEIWFAGLRTLLADKGLVASDEIASGEMSVPAKPVARVLRADQVAGALSKGAPVARPAGQPAQFSVGDHVVARNMHPTGHTRLPRYARGRPGVIASVHGVHVFPDSHAATGAEDPQWLYNVRFMARDLWGEQASPRDAVHIDLWESYLDPAA